MTTKNGSGLIACCKAWDERTNVWLDEHLPRVGRFNRWFEKNKKVILPILFVIFIVLPIVLYAVVYFYRKAHMQIIIVTLLCAFGWTSVFAGESTPSQTNTVAQGQFVLLSVPQEPVVKPKSVACGVAVAVIVVGGYIYYKLYNLCKQKLGTNAPSGGGGTNTTANAVMSTFRYKPQSLTAADTNVYAAWFKAQGGFGLNRCGCGESVSMDYTLSTGSEGMTSRVSSPIKTSPNQTVDLASFPAFMQDAYGLSMSSNNCTSNRAWVASIPYVGIGAGGELVLTNGSATNYTVVVQRTTDFVTWSPVITTIVSPDLPIKFMDDNAPDDQGFYRTVTISTNHP